MAEQDILAQLDELHERAASGAAWYPGTPAARAADELVTAYPLLRSEMLRLRAENEDLKQSVIAFAGPWAGEWAHLHGLPDGHLHPEHYDLLERCGARMNDFTRAELPSVTQELTDEKA